MQQRRKIAMLEMTRLGTVWGFTRDERFVLGEAALGTVTTSTVVAWDATTGRVARHRDALDTSRELDEVTVAFFDEVDLKMYLVAFVVDPENDVHRLVFDDECWAGPARLPTGKALLPEIPTRNCPDLSVSFDAMMLTRGTGARSQP
jgi:hypothetical protein